MQSFFILLTNGVLYGIVQIVQMVQLIQILKDGEYMAWKFSGKSDVYVQIAEKYENYIKLGVLKNGEKLPSVRTAAEECGVNPNTVVRAYALLEEKGFIASLPKKGIYVSYIPTSECEELNECELTIASLKEKGVTRQMILSALDKIYKGEDR